MMNQTKSVYNLVATLVQAVHKVKYYVVHQMEWNDNGSNLDLPRGPGDVDFCLSRISSDQSIGPSETWCDLQIIQNLIP